MLRVLLLDPSAAVPAVTHNLANALADLGCQVDVATGPYWSRSVGRCVRRYRVRTLFYRRTQTRAYSSSSALSRGFWQVLRLLGHVLTLLRLLPETRCYDVFHVQWLPVPVLDAIWLRLVSRRLPVAYTVHNTLPHDSRGGIATRIVFASLYRAANVLFVHAEHTAAALQTRFRIAPNRIERIRHGGLDHLLELEATAGSLPPWLVNGAEPIILFLGQVRAYKGLDILLRSAAQLRRRIAQFRIVVAGRPGVDMKPYVELTRELELEDLVEYRLGYLEEHHLPAFFRAATVIAFPYRAVDQSGVAVGACTFGKAIVASRCGGLEEIVTEAENGLLVPVGDSNALAEALARIILDDQQRSRFERNSLRYARSRLSWARIARQTLRAYRRVQLPDPTQLT